MATLNDIPSEDAKRYRMLGNRMFRVPPLSPKWNELKAEKEAIAKKYDLTSSGIKWT